MSNVLPLPHLKRLDFEHAVKDVGSMLQRDPGKVQQLTEFVQSKTVTYGGVKRALETLARADFSKTPAYFRKGLSALVPSVISFLKKIGSKPEIIDILKNLASHTSASYTMKKIGGRRRKQTFRKNQQGGNRITTIMTMIIFLVTICQMSSAFRLGIFKNMNVDTRMQGQNDMLSNFKGQADISVPTVNTQFNNVAPSLPPPYVGDFGTVVINENDSYVGNRLNGLYHGYGELRKDGNIYTMNFVNGTSGNLGKIDYKNGDTYVGEIKDLEPYGDGVYFKDGVMYEGNFRKEGDVLVGVGQFKTAEYTYIGEFRNGIPEGFGEKIEVDNKTDKSTYQVLHGTFKYGHIEGVGKISGHTDDKILYNKIYTFRNGKMQHMSDPYKYEKIDDNIFDVRVAVGKSVYNANINYENAMKISQEFLNQDEAEQLRAIKEEEEQHNEEMKRIANEIKQLEINQQKAKEVRRNYMTKIAQQSQEEEKIKTMNTMKALENTITDLNDKIANLQIRQSEALKDLQASRDEPAKTDKALQDKQAENADLRTQQSKTLQESLEEISDKKRELEELNSMYEKSLDEIKLLKAVEPVQVTRSQPSVPHELQEKVVYAADNIAFPLLIVIFAALHTYKKNASRIQFIKSTEHDYEKKVSENESEFDAIDTVVDDDKNFDSRVDKYDKMVQLLIDRLGFVKVQREFYNMYDEKEKMSAMDEKERSTETLLNGVMERKKAFVKQHIAKLDSAKTNILKNFKGHREANESERGKRNERIASLEEEKTAIEKQYEDSAQKSREQQRSLEQSVSDLNQKLKSSNITSSSLEKQIQGLKETSLHEQKQYETDVKRLATEVRTLKTNKLNNDKKIQNLEKDIYEARSNYSKKVHEYQYEVAALKGLHQKLKQNLEDDIEKISAKKNRATEKIDSMKEAHGKEIERLGKEIKDMETGLQDKIREQEREISELKEKVLREKQEVDRQRKELESKSVPSAMGPSENKSLANLFGSIGNKPQETSDVVPSAAGPSNNMPREVKKIVKNIEDSDIPKPEGTDIKKIIEDFPNNQYEEIYREQFKKYFESTDKPVEVILSGKIGDDIIKKNNMDKNNEEVGRLSKQHGKTIAVEIITNYNKMNVKPNPYDGFILPPDDENFKNIFEQKFNAFLAAKFQGKEDTLTQGQQNRLAGFKEKIEKHYDKFRELYRKYLKIQISSKPLNSPTVNLGKEEDIKNLKGQMVPIPPTPSETKEFGYIAEAIVDQISKYINEVKDTDAKAATLDDDILVIVKQIYKKVVETLSKRNISDYSFIEGDVIKEMNDKKIENYNKFLQKRYVLQAKIEIDEEAKEDVIDFKQDKFTRLYRVYNDVVLRHKKQPNITFEALASGLEREAEKANITYITQIADSLKKKENTEEESKKEEIDAQIAQLNASIEENKQLRFTDKEISKFKIAIQDGSYLEAISSKSSKSSESSESSKSSTPKSMSSLCSDTLTTYKENFSLQNYSKLYEILECVLYSIQNETDETKKNNLRDWQNELIEIMPTKRRKEFVEEYNKNLKIINGKGQFAVYKISQNKQLLQEFMNFDISKVISEIEANIKTKINIEENPPPKKLSESEQYQASFEAKKKYNNEFKSKYGERGQDYLFKISKNNDVANTALTNFTTEFPDENADEFFKINKKISYDDFLKELERKKNLPIVRARTQTLSRINQQESTEPEDVRLSRELRKKSLEEVSSMNLKLGLGRKPTEDDIKLNEKLNKYTTNDDGEFVNKSGEVVNVLGTILNGGGKLKTKKRKGRNFLKNRRKTKRS